MSDPVLGTERTPPDSSQPPRAFSRREQDGKMTKTQTTAALSGVAMGTATVLYLLGCLKGHQFYQPDDALVLSWCAFLGPVAQFLWEKFQHRIGMPTGMLLACLFLSGCQHVPTQVQPVVDLGCKTLPLLDLSFRLFGPQIGASQEQMKWEIGLVRTLTAACASRDAGSEAIIEAGLNAIADFLRENGVQPSPVG